MIVNKRIAKYSKIIQILNIASFAVSVLVIISQGIDRAVNGIWSMWKDLNVGILNENLISLYIVGILCSPIFVLVLSALFSSRLLIRIDSLRIYECVKLCENVNSNKIRIKLTVGDYLLMCIPVIFDICGSFLFAMFNSAFFTNGYFAIIFGRYLGSFVGAHLFSYVTIIFYAMCCKEKKKELLKELPKYIEEQRKFITEKQEKEQVVKDKLNAKILIEQCGMKFFLKYYTIMLRLPIRDIEVDEDFTPEEKNERLVAAKSIITQGFSKYAAQHIWDNYGDLLTDCEKNIANDILAEQ